jgi:Ca2+-binding RTX toxin-like protein
MAVATAHKPVNMNTFEIWDEYDVPQYSSTYIRQIGFDGERQDWFGHGFTFNLTNGTLTGGTVTQTIGYQDGVKQFTITGLNHNALTIYNELNTFDAQGLLGYAFNGNDQMTGSSGADVINGYNGNDKINGGLGSDRINGGAGNDTITWGTGDIVNGGAGKDILKVSAALLDLTTLADNKIVNVETINLAGTTTLKLNLQDLLAFPGDDLKVTGNGADTVDFEGTLGTGTAEGVFTRYSLGGGASLLIDSDINVV